MNQFPQRGPIELGYDSAHIGMFGKVFNSRHDFTDEPNANLGNALFRVPVLNVAEVLQRGFRNSDGATRHWLCQTKASSCFGQTHLPTGLQIIDSLYDSAQEFAFFLGVLVFGNGLYNRHAASSASQ